jgi:hypothetical protein
MYPDKNPNAAIFAVEIYNIKNNVSLFVTGSLQLPKFTRKSTSKICMFQPDILKNKISNNMFLSAVLKPDQIP